MERFAFLRKQILISSPSFTNSLPAKMKSISPSSRGSLVAYSTAKRHLKKYLQCPNKECRACLNLEEFLEHFKHVWQSFRSNTSKSPRKNGKKNSTKESRKSLIQNPDPSLPF